MRFDRHQFYNPFDMKNHNPGLVRVYDFKTNIFTTIPAVELAPGMIQASVNGELCWIDPQKAKLNKSPFRHPPFDEDVLEELQRLVDVFNDVYSLNLKQWEDGFRRDMHPRQQIAAWLYMADVYEEITARFSLIQPQKQELFGILITCSTTKYENISLVTSPQILDAAIANEAIQQYYGHPELKKEAASKSPDLYPDPSGNIPRPVESLHDPAERELLKTADIIYGVDSSTGHSGLFYGKDTLKQIVESGEALELRSTSYLYDSRTDQLELLVAVIKLVKGKCDYPGA